jgi:hypothetical protein
LAYLKQTIQDLTANIFLIRREQLRVQELVDISRKVVFGQQVFHFTHTASAFLHSFIPFLRRERVRVLPNPSEQLSFPSLSLIMKLARTFVSRSEVYESPQDVVDVLVGIVFGCDYRVEF